MNYSEKEQLIKLMEKNKKNILEELYDICWNMRGFTREDAFNLSQLERKIIHKQIKERIEIVEKTKLPLL